MTALFISQSCRSRRLHTEMKKSKNIPKEYQPHPLTKVARLARVLSEWGVHFSSLVLPINLETTEQ